MKILFTALLFTICSLVNASPMNDLATQIHQKAELAISQFQERAGGKLDYSVKSLEVIDEMLAEASDFVEVMPPEHVNSLVNLMGSYILSVAHKEHGGNFYWHDEKDQPILVVGEPNYKVALMAINKVRSRLQGDKADSIPFFYKGFSDRVKNAEKGTDAIYL
jgi:hypothetical protein